MSLNHVLLNNAYPVNGAAVTPASVTNSIFEYSITYLTV